MEPSHVVPWECMYIAIGKISQPHGTKGYVRAFPYSEIPQRFLGVKVLYVETELGMQGFVVEDVLLRERFALLKFKHVETREDAKTLTGKEIWIPEDQRIDLPDDVYFIHDLIGLQVFDVEGNMLGILEEVWVNTGNDVYVVRRNGQEILIPAVSEFVKEVNLSARRMVVQLIEGMVE